MFLEKMKRNNNALIDFTFWAHRSGALLPDTYLVDLDSVVENAEMIKAAADRSGVALYFMLKQLGRNPDIARALASMGFGSAVTVDFKEALGYIHHGIPLGNVGHLVQTPDGALERILGARPEIVTVYSIEKARRINEIAAAFGYAQDIMLRVVGEEDQLYSGQVGGFRLDGLEQVSHALMQLPNIRVAGICAFPCFSYDLPKNEILPASNARTVAEAAACLRALGHEIAQLNMPSVSCTNAMRIVAEMGGTHAEPGHGLTGTTPWNAFNDAERQAVVYLSEVSHNFGGRGYCYGGGYYRRGHLAHAMTGASPGSAKTVSVTPPDDDSIDYHFMLGEPCPVGDTVVMAFRTQIFVTRSAVALVEGLRTGCPCITGLYDAQGNRLDG